MKFDFPEKHTHRIPTIDIPDSIWSIVDSIAKERSIRYEEVLETLIVSAAVHYMSPEETLVDIQKSKILERVSDDTPSEKTVGEVPVVSKKSQKRHADLASKNKAILKQGMEDLGKKRCTFCHEVKSVEEFYRNQGKCIPCFKTWQNERNKRRKELSAEKPKIVDKRTRQMKENDDKLSAKVKGLVVVCAYTGCDRKFVKGTAKQYKGMEYHSDICLQKVIDEEFGQQGKVSALQPDFAEEKDTEKSDPENLL